MITEPGLASVSTQAQSLYLLVPKGIFGEVDGCEGRVNPAHVGLAIEELIEEPILRVGIKPHPEMQMHRVLKRNRKIFFLQEA
jgi:hypothetical protein